jgi:hypothetical protein
MKIIDLLVSAITFGLLANNAAQAIEKATVEYDSKINWSSPIYDKSDGSIVHDRHSVNGYDIVSSWSKKGIRLNVTKKITELSQSQPVTQVPLCIDHNSDPKKNTCPGFPFTNGSNAYTYSRNYQISENTYSKNYPISHFIISINNRSYRYDQGSVSPQLAQALATAATNKNVQIKLFIVGEPEINSEIGTSTVKSWQQIFR